MSKRVCKTLTLTERVEVIRKLEQKNSQSSIAQQFGVHQSAISRIQKNKESIIQEWQNNNSNPDRKRKRIRKSEDVEEALLNWFSHAKSQKIPISGPLLREKANHLAEELGLTDFKASSGWIERWKDRHSIKFKKQPSEKKKEIDGFSADRWIAELWPNLIKDYQPRDIFNADETGLYWRAIPDDILSFKGAQASEAKVAKDQMTLLLGCNMDGSEKLEPLVIGKNKNPHCFKNVKMLPVSYEGNENAWMTAELWKGWLLGLDEKMRAKKRNILLICDNCVAHSKDFELTNINLVLLPTNMTSLIQPMNQGIVANFKKQYRSLVLRHIDAVMDDGATEDVAAASVAKKLTVLDSLHMQREAWSRITQSTIAKCYKRARFVFPSEEGENDDVDATQEVLWTSGMAQEDFDEYVAIDDDLPTEGRSNSGIRASILRSLKRPETENDDTSDVNEDAVDVKPVTFSTATQCMDVIRRFMEEMGCSSYDSFYTLQNEIHTLKRLNSSQVSFQNCICSTADVKPEVNDDEATSESSSKI